ncbi:MAG: hypothetical protein QNJ69_02285 [Gammaproteobacteria bacterium]|nr:hypothetical protein [Gammaproteobacteria bacterium]
MGDIYAAPEADLENVNPAERLGGNIEDALKGEIRISIRASLGEAWRAVKGFKLQCHIAFLLYFVISIVINMLSIPLIIVVTQTGADATVASLISYLVQIVATMITLPMFFGIHIMGIRHLADKPVSSAMIFQFFNRIPRLLLTYVLMSLLILIGFMLLVLPGIYLSVAYMYAMPLVVEKNMPAWRALETSRRVISKNWFKFFGILLLVMLINLLAIFTLGIAYIWTIPWSILTMSLIHIKLFGAEAQTLAD